MGASLHFYRVLLATQKLPPAARELATSVWLWFQEINGLTTATAQERKKKSDKLQLRAINVNAKRALREAKISCLFKIRHFVKVNMK